MTAEQLRIDVVAIKRWAKIAVSVIAALVGAASALVAHGFAKAERDIELRLIKERLSATEAQHKAQSTALAELSTNVKVILSILEERKQGDRKTKQ